jgi:hypothetical protein
VHGTCHHAHASPWHRTYRCLIYSGVVQMPAER